MRRLRNIILMAAFIAPLSGITYAAENWGRTRLTEQPYVGEMTENVMENEFIKKCDDNNNYTFFVTKEGVLLFKVDKQVPPYVELDEEGKIEQNPWVFLEGSTEKVYVNIDYTENDLYDFEQHVSRQKPCEVLTNLDNYVVKEISPLEKIFP